MKLFPWIQKRSLYKKLKRILPYKPRKFLRKMLLNTISAGHIFSSLSNLKLYERETARLAKLSRENTNVRRNLESKPKIHFVYFTCGRHFRHLFASLRSVTNIDFKHIGKIFVYADRNDPISPKQIEQLENSDLKNVIIKKTKYEMAWGGVNVIINELTAFQELTSEINENDYLAKVDSDVLFTSTLSLQKIIDSGKALIGQKYRIPKRNYMFSQGNCYFLKRCTAYEISRVSITDAIKKASRLTGYLLTTCPEDVAIFILASNYTDDIELWDDLYVITPRDQEGQHTVLVK